MSACHRSMTVNGEWPVCPRSSCHLSGSNGQCPLRVSQRVVINPQVNGTKSGTCYRDDAESDRALSLALTVRNRGAIDLDRAIRSRTSWSRRCDDLVTSGDCDKSPGQALTEGANSAHRRSFTCALGIAANRHPPAPQHLHGAPNRDEPA